MVLRREPQSSQSASGSLALEYSATWETGFIRLSGNVSYSFPPGFTLAPDADGQYVLDQQHTIAVSADASWDNDGLGFPRPTWLEISGGGKSVADDRGQHGNGSVSATVAIDIPFHISPGQADNSEIHGPAINVEAHGVQNQFINLQPIYVQQEIISQIGAEPTQQLVRAYEPREEFKLVHWQEPF